MGKGVTNFEFRRIFQTTFEVTLEKPPWGILRHNKHCSMFWASETVVTIFYRNIESNIWKTWRKVCSANESANFNQLKKEIRFFWSRPTLIVIKNS